MTAATLRWQQGVVAIAFVAVAVALIWQQPAWDLRGEYVAARVIAAGHIANLYDQAHVDAARQPGSAWSDAALAGGIADHVVVSYIKTPLWAWLLSPLAAAARFDVFKRCFTVVSAMALAGMVFAAARAWAPRLASPAWQAGLLAGLFVSVPFMASLLLGQSHILFVCLLVASAIAATRDRPVTAGALLALTASVKITPVWLAVTWLAAGRHRAVLSFAVSCAGLAALTLLAAGWPAVAAFIRTLREFGGTVLLAGNNDSLASVLLGGALNDDTAFHFRPVPSPAWVGLVSVLALASGAIAAGLLDRRARARSLPQTGSIITIVAATAFSPLAWNHYYVVLILPVMLFLDRAIGRRRAIWAALAAAVFLLDVPPLAYTAGAPMRVVALRSEFWAAMLCVSALLIDPERKRILF